VIALVLSVVLAAAPTPSKPGAKTKPPATKPAPASEYEMPPPPPSKPASASEATAPAASSESTAGKSGATSRELSVREPTIGPGFGPGFSLAGGPSILRLGARAGITLMQIDRNLVLQALLPFTVGYANSTVSSGLGSNVTTTIWGFEMLPSARVTGSLMPKVQLYGDVGLGFLFYQVSTPFPFVGTLSGSAAGLGIRLAAGLDYALTDNLSLLAEPIGLLFNTASSVTYNVNGNTVTASGGSGSQWQMWVGAAYRL